MIKFDQEDEFVKTLNSCHGIVIHQIQNEIILPAPIINNYDIYIKFKIKKKLIQLMDFNK